MSIVTAAATSLPLHPTNSRKLKAERRSSLIIIPNSPSSAKSNPFINNNATVFDKDDTNNNHVNNHPSCSTGIINDGYNCHNNNSSFFIDKAVDNNNNCGVPIISNHYCCEQQQQQLDYRYTPIVIIDGSHTIKCGLSNENGEFTHPTSVFHYKEAISLDYNKLQNPIERDGIFTKYNWDIYEMIWYKIFYEKLKILPSNHGIFITESLYNSKTNRETISQIIFENFNAPALYFGKQQILSLYAALRTTGLVVDSGDYCTTFVPIVDGCQLSAAHNCKVDIGGRDLTEYLIKIYFEKTRLKIKNLHDTFMNVKEQFCFVNEQSTTLQSYNTLQNTLQNNNNTLQRTYELPDGKTILTLDTERYQCPEILFHPSLIGKESPSITTQIYNSINNCEIDLKKELFENIILCGGNTMFEGLDRRINNELEKMVNNKLNVRVFASNDRNNYAYIGASILSSLSSFKEMFLTKEEYEEEGVCRIHKKFQ
ncbi:hypothetical protein ABK040_012075 [Willaertia magna]